jgi:predicted DCC family thiol-disulfide oxidoreductase YuxK
MRHGKNARVNFTPAQEKLGKTPCAHCDVDMGENYLLITHGRAFTASLGYLALCRILGGWWYILPMVAINSERLRDWLYAWIAANPLPMVRQSRVLARC